MAFQKQTDAEKITQVLPEKKQVPLEDLYLDQKLAALSAKIGRALVLADFVTDKNGVIAKANEKQQLQVPAELKNTSDWQLFQELIAQADVIIMGGDYFRLLTASGSHPQDILFQFEPGKSFERLGEWRLGQGKKRSPDVAIVTQHPDFELPQAVLSSDRRITVFTTYAAAQSDKARAFMREGVPVFGSGETGVDGNQMIDTLSHETGYRVIMMATGPRVLEFLLESKRLDLLYITEAQIEIPSHAFEIETILPGGKKVGMLDDFHLTHQYVQENVVTEDGSRISQLFLRYDKSTLPERRLNVS